MVLKEKIKIDLDKSLKSGEKLILSTLRLLYSVIGNKEIEKRTKIVKRKKDLTEKELIKKSQLQDEEIIQVTLSEIKKRKEAILLYKKGKREDLAQKEEKEIEILEKYLPEQISDEELQKLAKETIEKVGASSLKDMGKVMKELMIKVKGRAEGSKVSQIIKELLSK